MGVLPFVLEHSVCTAQVASENVVAGLLYLVAMAVAAGMTQVCTIKCIRQLLTIVCTINSTPRQAIQPRVLQVSSAVGAAGTVVVVAGLCSMELILFVIVNRNGQLAGVDRLKEEEMDDSETWQKEDLEPSESDDANSLMD